MTKNWKIIHLEVSQVDLYSWKFFLISENLLLRFSSLLKCFQTAKNAPPWNDDIFINFPYLPHWLGYWQFSKCSRTLPRNTVGHLRSGLKNAWKCVRLRHSVTILLFDDKFGDTILVTETLTYLGASCTKTKIAKADTRAVSVAKIPTTTRIIVTSPLVWCIGSHGWVQLSKPPKFQSG